MHLFRLSLFATEITAVVVSTFVLLHACAKRKKDPRNNTKALANPKSTSKPIEGSKDTKGDPARKSSKSKPSEGKESVDVTDAVKAPCTNGTKNATNTSAIEKMETAPLKLNTKPKSSTNGDDISLKTAIETNKQSITGIINGNVSRSSAVTTAEPKQESSSTTSGSQPTTNESTGKSPKTKKSCSTKKSKTKESEKDSVASTKFVIVKSKMRPARTKLRKRGIVFEKASEARDVEPSLSSTVPAEHSKQQSPISTYVKSEQATIYHSRGSPQLSGTEAAETKDSEKELLSEFRGIEQENEELRKLFLQLKDQLRTQHEQLDHDRVQVRQLLSPPKSSQAPADSVSEKKCKSKQPNWLNTPSSVRYKKIIVIRNGQSIARYIPHAVQERALSDPNSMQDKSES